MSPYEIRKTRKALDLNRKDFGELIGVKNRTVEHYELGDYKPSPSVIMHLKRVKATIKDKK